MRVNRRLMAVVTLVVVLAALVVTTPAGATDGAATKCTVATVLKAGNEVPPSGSKAFGAALVHVARLGALLRRRHRQPGEESFFAGHIHSGVAG